MKKCVICKMELPLESFSKYKRTVDGLNTKCRICCRKQYKTWSDNNQAKLKEVRKKTDASRVDKKREYQRSEKSKEYHKQWYQDNKESVKLKASEWVKNNPDKVKAKRQRWISKPENRDKINAYIRQKRKDDPSFKIAHNVRTRLLRVLKGKRKYAKTMELLGCTSQELKEHLEKQFSPEMNWDNHGKYWHIDHVKPISWFNLTIEREMREACHYTNLKPMVASENMSKGNRWSEFDEIGEVPYDILEIIDESIVCEHNLMLDIPIITDSELEQLLVGL